MNEETIPTPLQYVRRYSMGYTYYIYKQNERYIVPILLSLKFSRFRFQDKAKNAFYVNVSAISPAKTPQI